ncbi:MAG: pilus assembly protein PilP [Desulfotignum sp.]|nr:pilus assembly protein PilP [Desulfotignum sp.]
MTYLTHKWLLILAVMLAVAIVVCEKTTATKTFWRFPVFHDMPRASSAQKKPQPANETESKEQMAEKQLVEAVRDPISADDMEIGNDGFDAAGPSYEAKSSLDPFMPLIQEKPATPSGAGEPDRPRRILTPLEKMSLSQIKLVAVVMGENLKIAMVEEATGKGYEVRIGTYMGKNGGQVVDIQPDRIIVREMVMDFKGIMTERFQEVKLHKADSGE